MSDFHYHHGTWTPIDFSSEWADGQDEDDFFKSKGWAKLCVYGKSDETVAITVWSKLEDDNGMRVMSIYDGSSYCAPYIMTEDIIDYMDLLSRWAPAIELKMIE